MNRQNSFWFSSKGLAALGLVGAVTYFLLMEHREHLFQALPYLIIMLCPLMHVFMHGSHGHDHHQDRSSDNDISVEDAYRQGYKDGMQQSNENKEDDNAR